MARSVLRGGADGRAHLHLEISQPARLAIGPGQCASSAFGVLGKPFVNVGLAAMALQFMGRFMIHPPAPVSRNGHAGGSVQTLAFVAAWVSGLVGNALIGRVMGRWLRHTLLMLPICSACVALALAQWGTVAWAVALLMALWGLFSTAASVPWWTWLSRTLPRDAEAGGGAMVAVIQLSITLGAALGGMMYDRVGYQPTFVAGASLLVVAGLAGMGSMPKTAPTRRIEGAGGCFRFRPEDALVRAPPASRFSALQGDGQASRDKDNLLRRLGHGLVQPTGRIAKPAGQRIVGNDAQSHFIGHQRDGAGACAQRIDQPGAGLINVVIAQHQVGKPQRQAVHQHPMGGCRLRDGAGQVDGRLDCAPARPRSARWRAMRSAISASKACAVAI
jgi:hypothetical protein